MAIIPAVDKDLIRIYWCPICKKRWSANLIGTRCLVDHRPGDCCHYNEFELSLDDTHKINDLINELKQK